ncbi:hypothetical protein [Tolypothrix sp. PCC 7910]|uniref:hypothetical protein n=1 Tax=Tolypothrix sp. PCC 7910 TaxID=2099387 RepID=UPI001AD7C7F5|nr:hypothetical protein [Tolypothrix sp. PCC 7910]
MLIRAKEERAGMNLAKFLTLGTAATGAICYAYFAISPHWGVGGFCWLCLVTSPGY